MYRLSGIFCFRCLINPFRHHRHRKRNILLVFLFAVFLVFVLNQAKETFILEDHPTKNRVRQKRSVESNSTSYSVYQPIVTPNLPKSSLNLLILINSSPYDLVHYEKREAIRNTWGNCHLTARKYKCKLVFYVGITFDSDRDQAISEEASLHDDLIICNVLDQYSDITSKFLCALNWTTSLQYDHLLKTDDDVFIDVPSLVTYLSYQPKQNLYAGYLYTGPVSRVKGDRHYISEADYAHPTWPKFCVGAMYVMSSELPSKVLEMTSVIRPFFIDDAYVGVVLHNASIRPTHIDQFYHWDSSWMVVDILSDCLLQQYMGISHRLSSAQIYDLYRRYHNPPSDILCFFQSNLYVSCVVAFFVLIALLAFLCKRS